MIEFLMSFSYSQNRTTQHRIVFIFIAYIQLHFNFKVYYMMLCKIQSLMQHENNEIIRHLLRIKKTTKL
jgi:hypothetical protein